MNNNNSNNKKLIISKLIYSKFHIFKELPIDIIKKIYSELKDYYKNKIYVYLTNKIINSLNFLGRSYYIKSQKKIIYKDCMNNIIKFEIYYE